MVDTTIAGVRIAGLLGPSATRCLQYNGADVSQTTGVIRAYLASTLLSLTTASNTSMSLQTAAIPTLPPGRTRPDLPSLQAILPQNYSWNVAESVLPALP